MKVECVEDHSVWQLFCCPMSLWPICGMTYTVAGFASIEDHPGIYLYELPPVSCKCCSLDNAPWPLEIFRPLNERKTDIGELMKILDQRPVIAFFG